MASPSTRQPAGLKNFGNTCYLNAVVQGLSNLQELEEYFSQGSFEGDINFSSGSAGRAATEFSEVMSSLHSGLFDVVTPTRLKNEVGYPGHEQHDALEFFRQELIKRTNPETVSVFAGIILFRDMCFLIQ